MKELLCGIVFILYVDYKYFINPYSWIKREKMSDHYFKCMPIDRFNHFDRYVKFHKLTNLTDLTNFSDMTNFADLTNLTNFTYLTNLTNFTY